MNKKLSDAATKAVHAKTGFTKEKSMCQKFTRQVIQSVYGSKFDKFFKGSAKETGEAFLKDGKYVIDKKRGSVPGDLLYKLDGSGGFGHVGIRVEQNQVAENSVRHYARSGGRDGRGFRSLQEFGDFDLIIRLGDD